MSVVNDESKDSPAATRRGFLAAAGGLVAATGLSAPAVAAAKPAPAVDDKLPFWGAHQAGIITPAQAHTYVVAFDIVSAKREDVVALLQRWTDAAARMAAGATAEEMGADINAPGRDSGEAMDLPPARLTVTFGFGAGLFVKDGQDRFGLAAQRPAAFVDLPKFTGDQLVEGLTGGDLLVQACADDTQVAFHAVRQLVRLAYEVAEIRWAQVGFIGGFGPDKTPRNLMGFKDGTGNPTVGDARAMDEVVWVGQEGPAWMRGGSYGVFRRTRMALEHWDRMKVSFQEETFGRRKYSGAPIGKTRETEVIDLAAVDGDGNPALAENSHVRLATAATNDGARVLRRSYSYNNGVSFTAERWPPWHQGMEYDAGLIFVCYQRDPRTGFIKIFETMAKFDMMNQFVTHIGGGLFAFPGGAAKGEYIGQRLFQAV
ncbi:MAG: iron uptake transporter deferrochelatase/peroxidase subunit [Azospirillaceae bacterium]|nr:iron uptake transporter deferrochelatase/peroxidase subunit [Azospirillaceae bacterium]